MRTISTELTDEQDAGLDVALQQANDRIAAHNEHAEAQYRKELAAWETAASDYEERKRNYRPLPRRKVLVDAEGKAVMKKVGGHLETRLESRTIIHQDVEVEVLVPVEVLVDYREVEVLDPQCLEAQGLTEVPAEFPPMPPRPMQPMPRPMLSEKDDIIRQHVGALLRALERKAP